MQYQCGANLLELVSGDICDQRVDAIVNAANESLAAGGKVVLTNTGFAQELSNISKSVVVIPINPSSIDVKNSLGMIQDSPYPHANIRESFNYLNFLKEFIPK